MNKNEAHQLSKWKWLWEMIGLWILSCSTHIFLQCVIWIWTHFGLDFRDYICIWMDSLSYSNNSIIIQYNTRGDSGWYHQNNAHVQLFDFPWVAWVLSTERWYIVSSKNICNVSPNTNAQWFQQWQFFQNCQALNDLAGHAFFLLPNCCLQKNTAISMFKQDPY